MFSEFTLDTKIGEISALRNSTLDSPHKVLAVHGWLDNRASFIPMLPYMNDTNFVAIDLPGHGYSSHTPGAHFAYLADYVQHIDQVLDTLGWQQCHLLGHSMGAGVCSLLAACAPQRVQSLSLIDLLGPLSTAAEEAPDKLAQALQDYSQWDPNRGRWFDDLEDATQARIKGSVFPLGYDHSKLLMQYATQQQKNGLQLMSDARLKFTSPLSFTEAQVLAFIGRIKQSTLLVYASDGILDKLSSTPARLEAYANLTRLDLSGGHYVHMEQPQAVAVAVLTLIKGGD